MAIYQFYLALVPRHGLVKKHIQIPNKIFVSTETGYFESKTEEYWGLSEVSPEEIVHDIDKLVNRASWGNDKLTFNWKTKTTDLDNDASMSINVDSGKIEELSFRADLREHDLKFLKEMVGLAIKYDFLLMDIKGNLANPNSDEIKPLIKISKPYKFLTDPDKFLTNLLNKRNDDNASH